MPDRQARALKGGMARALTSLVSALEALPTPGMIIGGIAVILHGVPRLTRDIDATVAAHGVALDELIITLRAHGITPRIADAIAFAAQSQVVLLRHEATGVDVDLSLASLPFELEAIAARQRIERGPVTAEVARPEDLIVYKAIAWRPQDQQDIERLLTLYASMMDLGRVRHIVSELAEALEESDRLQQLEALIKRVELRG